MSADDQQGVPGAERPPGIAQPTGPEHAPNNPFASPSGSVPEPGPIPASAAHGCPCVS